MKITEKEIIEGNILIAKFMNHKIWVVKHYEGDEQSDREEISVSDYDKILARGFGLDIYARPFHYSWNLLMPVVEKIHSDTDFWVTIYYRSCKIFPMQAGVEMEIHIEEKPTIEAVWLAVVEFIKWLNRK